MNIQKALQTLGLTTPFTLIDLKSAYRRQVKLHHPDMGGREQDFIKVDAAYDLLQSSVSDKHKFGSPVWEKYYSGRLADWEKEFRERWKKICRKSDSGLFYSTFIERFRRGHIEPKAEWFRHLAYTEPTPACRQKYRERLLALAPNRRLAEVWAYKYYKLEFGQDCPWTFYLPPSKVAPEVGV